MTRFTTLFHSSTFRVAGAVAALAVAAPFTVPVHAAEKIEGARCGRAQTTKTLGWERIKRPAFQPGLGIDDVPTQIVSYAVSPANEKLLAATNGNSVYISRDGGCGWTPGFTLDRVPGSIGAIRLSGLVTKIRSVHISANGTFFALAEELDLDAGPAVGRPHILRSKTGEAGTWELADEGLPPLGKPLVMRSHPTNPRVLYVTFEGAKEEDTGPACPPPPVPCPGTGKEGRDLGLMYRSTDGGQTWQSRVEPENLDSVKKIKYFSVDDDDRAGNTVWLVAGGVLQLSTDGGRNFDPPAGLDQSDFEFTAVESLRAGPESQGLSVVAFGRGGGRPGMIRLQDGEWKRTNLPFASPVESIAQRDQGDIAVATMTSGSAPNIWRAYPRSLVDRESDLLFPDTDGWQAISPPQPSRSPIDARISAGGGTAPHHGTYFLMEREGLLRFLGSSLFNEPAAPGVDIVPPLPPLGRITPSTLALDLGVDKSKTVDYTLTLPPSPTPLDVYLLVDNSGSMLATIEDLQLNLREVALALHEAGINVGIGIGQINVQPNSPQLPIDDPRTPDVDEGEPKPIYKNLRKIGPVNSDLFRQLEKLTGSASGGSEPQLEALYQSVVPDGLRFEGPFGYLDKYKIPEGQDAGFRYPLRPIKVIVHATDENFTGTPDADGTPDDESIKGDGAHNSIEPVAAVLKEAGVKQIGLSLNNEDAAEDLRKMADLTGALAPRGGVDCDGDGRNDIAAGEPLVCDEATGMDKTLVNLLRSLSDPQTITLSKKASPTMVEVSREEFRIDAKQDTKVRFSVTYSCKGLEPGEYTNDLTAGLRGDLIAKATATITCGALGGILPRPQQPAEELGEPASNPPPVQPQPVVPATVPLNPVPQPQTQVQTQTQVNPQAGMADQEEQQFQLAGVTNDLNDESEQLAMTGLSYEDAALGVLGAGMAMATAAGVGVALRRRTRVAPARATTRRF